MADPLLNRDLIPQYGQLFLLKQDAGFTGKQRLFLQARLRALKMHQEAGRIVSQQRKALWAARAKFHVRCSGRLQWYPAFTAACSQSVVVPVFTPYCFVFNCAENASGSRPHCQPAA
jgi:hypothetical protein